MNGITDVLIAKIEAHFLRFKFNKDDGDELQH